MFPTRRIITSGGDVYRDEYSLEFDGTNDYISLSAVSTVQSLAVGTISCWFKPASDSSGTNALFSASDLSEDNSYLLLYQRGGSDDRLDFDIIEGGSTSFAGHTGGGSLVPDYAWHHVVVTVSASGNSIYIDGVKKTVTYGTGNASTQAFFNTVNNIDSVLVGAMNDSGGLDTFFNGHISEFAMWDVALTTNQVKTLYNGKEPFDARNIAKSDLISYLRFGDGSLDFRATSGFIANSSSVTDTTIGDEVMENGDMDSDNPTLNTVAVTNSRCTSARDTGQKHSGTHSYKVTHDGSSTNANFYVRFNSGLTNGKIYKTSVWVYLPAGLDTNEVSLLQKLNGSEITYDLTTTTASWVKLTSTFTADTTGSAGSNYFFMTVRGRNTSGNAGTSDYYYWDDMTVKEVTGDVGSMVNFDGGDFKTDVPR